MNELERVERRQYGLQLCTEYALATVGGVVALLTMQMLPYQLATVRVALWVLVSLIGLVYVVLLRSITEYKGLPRMLWLVGLTPYYPFGRLFGLEFSVATGWAAVFSLVLAHVGWILLHSVSHFSGAQRN